MGGQLIANKILMSTEIPYYHFDQSRTNGPINAHLTIAQVMPKYNLNNEKQEALL